MFIADPIGLFYNPGARDAHLFAVFVRIWTHLVRPLAGFGTIFEERWRGHVEYVQISVGSVSCCVIRGSKISSEYDGEFSEQRSLS